MNRRYFLSSSLAVGAFTALTRLPVADALVREADRSNPQGNKLNAKEIKKELQEIKDNVLSYLEKEKIVELIKHELERNKIT